MASNREERLQMRQRGAGTRRIKEVNFGFSFGLAPPPEEPFGAASQPADVDTPVESPALPQAPPASENTRPPSLSPPRELQSSQDRESLQRTPGSARNSLPERPSTFDIPEDDALDLGRSSKRRKIESPSQASRLSVNRDFTQQEKQSSPVPQNGAQSDEPVPGEPLQPRDEALNVQGTSDIAQMVTPQEALDSTAEMGPDKPQAESATREGEPSEHNDAKPKSPEIHQESPETEGTPTNGDTTKGKHKRRGSSTDQHRRRSAEGPETGDESAQQPESQDIPLEENHKRTTGKEYLKFQPGQRRKGRPRTSTPSPPATDKGAPQSEVTSTESTPADSIPTQRETRETLRSRNGKNQTEVLAASETPNGQSVEADNAPEEGNTADRETSPHLRQEAKEAKQKQKRVGRPAKKTSEPPESAEMPQPAGGKRTRRKMAQEREPEPETEREPKAPTEPEPAGRRRTRRKETEQEQEREREPEPEPEPGLEPSKESKPAGEKRTRRKMSEPEPQPELQPEPSTEPKTVDEKRKRRRKSEQQQEPEPQAPTEPEPTGKKRTRRRKLEQEAEAEAEPEREPEAPKEPESSPAPKRGRGRPSLSKKEPAAEHETGGEASRTAKMKPKQPRGETVPVTVHRLANVTSLEGIQAPESLGEEEESADELSTRQKTKIPSRGDVNVADVLSQICRETLEKTLTTLNNGIANEENAARRSEFTTKKKAVEVFGTELEGRLFELSEMLDSNFVLGVKLKKTKREMMDMRSRLYHLRKEREAVALQMDAVRRKHTEEENARLARANINNSLHSLDLTLERSQNRPARDSDDEHSSDSSLTTGLEFMLRSVAENVSSRAPGAHGGLLSQIKAFNAQLEAAARTLES
ncbi:hypothetical protein BBP40_008287 [Aspergillus hancockii]|nr:hypothetical protein BBP40_008287 [Aspergillus hancockii]